MAVLNRKVWLRGWAPFLTVLALLVMLMPANSFPQSSGLEAAATRGTLTGHVRAGGAVAVPGATIELTETQTGARLLTWTDEAGDYTFSGVSPGTYKLQVSLVGFRTDVREPVPVAAGKSLKVNVALVVALPEEASMAVGRTPPSGLPNLQSLPPEARERLRQLAAAGGASGSMGDASEAGAGGAGSVRFSESGAPGGQAQGEAPDAAAGDSGPSDSSSSAANSFLLSGSVGRAPTPGDEEAQWRERAQEFRRTRESQSAPGFPGGGGGFGGGGGEGPMIFWTGAGRGRRPQVNRLRGNIVECYSNSALDAHPYPLNVAQSPQIASYQEQVGATIGGPLVIPKIYHRPDKTSFFFHYNLKRRRKPFDSFSTVPTAAERLGDFSQSVIASGPLAGTVPTIYDPRSNPLGPRQAFLGNRIPADRFDLASQGLLKYIPLPNLPGNVQNFHLQEALPSDNDRVMGRIGQQISAKDSLNGIYFFNSSRSQSVGSFPGLTRNISARSRNVSRGETHTFNAHAVNNLMLNFNRQRSSTLNPFAYQQDIASQLGIQGISQDPRDWGLPIIAFTNFASLNDAIPSLVRNQTLRAFDFLLLSRGKHNVRVGGEVRRVQLNTLTDPDARGTFTFNGYTTSDFSSQGAPLAGTGFDFADFLLGLPQVTSVRFGTSANYLRSWVYSGFVQDDWRVTSRLTLNLGLRYEYFQPFTEKYGHLSDLAIGPDFSSVAVVTGQSPGLLPASLLRSDKNNLGPRVGLAFRPWTKSRLVLRAGYGIFYDGSIYQRLTPNLANQPPFAEASTLVTTPRQMLTLEAGFPSIAPGIARNTYAIDPNFRTPYGQTWNFTIEDEIARNLILSIGYLGTKGTKLDLLVAPNPVLSTSGLSTGSQLRALQFEYETSGAASIYHSLQVSLRRQFHHGLSVSADYTFSKSIDDASSVGGTASVAGGKPVAQNFLDLEAERGLSAFDVRHRLRLNHTYEFPFGERHRYLNHGGMLAHVVGDWQISGNAQLQSGLPWTARVLGNLSNNTGVGAYGSERADATGQPITLPAPEQSTLRYFNTGAFALPLPGQFGNAGRNTIPGPRTVTFNMSLGRFVTLSQEKGVRADFRIEANNIFNTPSYSGLGTVVNAADFGRVTAVQGMRTLEFSLRLRF